MFGLKGWEWIIVLVIVLIVFGVGKLPEIGGALGKSIREFKKAKDQADAEDKAKTAEQPSNIAEQISHSQQTQGEPRKG